MSLQLAIPTPPSKPPAPLATETLRELDGYLARLHAALRELLELAGEKLAALRKADGRALQHCALREELLVRDVLFGEQQREALLARVAQGLRLPGCPPGGLTEILEHVPEPWQSSWRARGVGLRQVATELQRKNRIVSQVAHNLHWHIRSLFASVAQVAQESVVYGANGTHETSVKQCWVDAVG